MEIEIIKATFYYDNHFYYNGEEFLKQNFNSKQELLDVVSELKKQYPNLKYTYEIIH
jgi:hypothetical protein